MTAEVAIMNTQGIALAADSAVTLGAGNGKTYNSADKLFALSKYHPVGIMINGSASIMGIEWETIIKSYRDFLGTKSFDTLAEYTGDFINYLSKFPYFTDAHQKKYLESTCFEVFSHILSWFIDDLHDRFDGDEHIEQSDIDAFFDETLGKIKERMEKTDDEKQIKVDTDYVDENMEIIDNMIKTVFENYSVSKNQKAAIIGILKQNFQKCGWVDSYSGIVIAGYGEREIFPNVHDFKAAGRLGKSLIYFGESTDKIDGIDNTASIIPYAQTEMVHQFARGIDPDFFEIITNKFEAVLHDIAAFLKDEDKLKINSYTALLADHITEISNRVYTGPILDIVSCMQKSELAAMAESMVNLTALKRHVSTDSETVGGPVDVAIISKGDGFIWIKKKTNYDPHINNSLRQNYFRGGKNGDLL